MIKFIITVAIAFFALLANGQSEIKTAKEGTFQFVQKSKIQEVFTSEKYEEIKQIIASKRKENSEVTISISELTSVRILSKNEIVKPTFEPFNTLFQ